MLGFGIVVVLGKDSNLATSGYFYCDHTYKFVNLAIKILFSIVNLKTHLLVGKIDAMTWNEDMHMLI